MGDEADGCTQFRVSAGLLLHQLHVAPASSADASVSYPVFRFHAQTYGRPQARMYAAEPLSTSAPDRAKPGQTAVS